MAQNVEATAGNWTKEFVESPVITLIVGRDIQEQLAAFYAHGALLRDVPFFDRMLSSSFRETEEKIVHLPTDDPQSIELMLAFLHDKSLSSPRCQQMASTNLSYETTLPRLAGFWIAADKFQFLQLQNELLASMFQWVHGTGANYPLGIDKLKDIYARTVPRSALRKFAVVTELGINTELTMQIVGSYGATQEIQEDLLVMTWARIDKWNENALNDAVYQLPKTLGPYLVKCAATDGLASHDGPIHPS